jgi:muramidase (phage lysozyme)
VTLLDECAAALESPRMLAFLAMIRAGEGTSDADGYRRHFGGELFDSFADHPRRKITKALGGRPITSSAAGAYQFLAATWDECRAALGLPDFTPRSQDLAAVFLLRRRKALDAVLAGDVRRAIALCAREWASLPGSPYGQPVKTMAQALAVYEAALGEPPPTPQPAPENLASVDPDPPLVHLGPEPPDTAWPFASPVIKEPTMPIPAVLAAVLPSLIESIPRLGKLFGSGSEVAERNVKAAEIAAGIVKEAVGARNDQEAAEMVQSDPALAKVAREAVEARWLELTEAGGGGIEGARRADAAIMAGDGPWWSFLRSPSFWCLLILAPLVYLLVGSLIGLWGSATWSDDVRAGLAGSIVSTIIGAAVGYYWGQTTSRNRAAG